jgi:competence protein ComEC
MAWASGLDDAASSPSRSLALACGAFCAGIAIGPFLGLLGDDNVAFAVLLLIVPLLFLPGRKAVAGVILCAGLAAGIARSLLPLTVAFPTPALALSARDGIVALLGGLVPEPDASLLGGLIFGGQFALARKITDAFRATGTSHVLSASGFNVSLVTQVFLRWVIETRLGRNRGILVAFALLVAYVFMAGASASVVRAALMASTLLLGMAMRRKASARNILLLAASVMLAFSPGLVGDVGFQLSFVATAAIMIASAPIEARLAFLPKRFGIRESFAASLAAIVATAPVILWHFGTYSVVAPLANLLVLPLVPYAMALTFIALAFGLVSVSLGAFVALPAGAMAGLMLWAVSSLAAVPYANVSLPAAHLAAMGATLLSLVIFFQLSRRPLAKSVPW